MKIIHQHSGRARQAGMVTVLFIALLSIMLILVMAESKSLFRLHQEVKFLEQRQIKRLLVATATNAIVATTLESK
jgi:hypothetical protein